MRNFTASLAAGVAMLIATASTSAAPNADLNGIWLPTERNIISFGEPPPGSQPGVRPPRLGAPPYNPEWAAKYRQRVEEGRTGKVTVDPTAECLPPGMPRTMSTPFPFEFSVEKDRVLVLFEIGGVRRIWTDGRPHPAADDLSASFMGHSVGHWEGDTLVVDTVGLRDDTVFDATGAQHSDKMHIVERIRLTAPDKMEDRITIDDPGAFTGPWNIVHTYDRMRDWQIMEFVCEENNRGVFPGGDAAPAK